ncbi:unnamed protein product [Calicophoron daubneyi]|uniref:Kinase n=1 Tax=Calicophoron daubneyi TaxID=300641 RepID=A0AAV2TEA3_CALDB
MFLLLLIEYLVRTCELLIFPFFVGFLLLFLQTKYPKVPLPVEEANPLPSEVIPITSQIAGHRPSKYFIPTFLRHPKSPVIYKWVQNNANGLRELRFFQMAFANDAPEFFKSVRMFIPTYFGTFYSKDEQRLYIGMNDLLAPFKRPNVCDIKIGTVSYHPDASLEKRLYEEQKYPWRKSTGLLFCGIQVYDEELDTFFVSRKHFGLTLDFERSYSVGLKIFLGCEPRRRARLAQAFLPILNNLLNWFKETGHAHFRFCRSSVLLIYDALPTGPVEHVDVKLIDFAHWFEVSPMSSIFEPGYQLTSGFIYGLSRLISMMHRIIDDSLFDPKPSAAPNLPQILFNKKT